MLLQGDPWTPQVLASSVQAGLQPNPLAASLGLLSEEAVAAFVAAGLPGLDLILLSARYVSVVPFRGPRITPFAFHSLGSWLESLASLVVGFHWTLLDGVDLYSTAEPDRMPVVLAQNGSVLEVPAPEVRRPMAIRVGVESIEPPPFSARQLPVVGEELAQGIDQLTRWDQMLYAAAEQR